MRDNIANPEDLILVLLLARSLLGSTSAGRWLDLVLREYFCRRILVVILATFSFSPQACVYRGGEVLEVSLDRHSAHLLVFIGL